MAAGGLEAVVGILCSQVQVARRRELDQAAGKRLAWPAALGCTDKQQGSAHRRGCHTHEAVAPPATHPQ